MTFPKTCLDVNLEATCVSYVQHLNVGKRLHGGAELGLAGGEDGGQTPFLPIIGWTKTPCSG